MTTYHNDAATTAAPSDTRSHRSAGTVLRYLLATVLTVVALAVILDNSQRVEVGYVFGDRRAPLWFVMLASAVAGVVIAWLVQHRPHRRH